MADTNHTRRDDYMEFSENDPFAELTRIMGHDPRETQPTAPDQGQGHVAAVPVEGEVDFALDLERELAADLDFSDFDEPAPEADWRVQEDVATHIAADQPVAVEASMPEPLELDEFELDSEFDAFFAEQTATAEPAIASPAAYQPEIPSDGMDQGYESLGDALEQELLADQAAWAEPEPVYAAPEPLYADPAPVSTEATYSEPAYDEPAYAEPGYEAAVYPQEPVSAPVDAQVEAAEDDWAVEAEFDVDFLERELAASTAQDQPQFEPRYEAVTPPPASFEAEPFGELTAIEAVEETVEAPVDEDPVERPLSLEEELQLLLADEPLPVAQPVAAAPTANFGRANYSAVSSAAGPAVVAASAFVPAAAESPRNPAEEAVFSPAESPTEAYQSYQSTTNPAVDAFDEQPVESEYATPVAEVADDDFGDIFGDDFALHLDDEIDAEVYAGPDEAYASDPQDPDLPDIETVEVAETVPPVTDDLDIPEVDYGATIAAAPDFHDDFQSDFDHLFGDVTTGESKPAAVAASVAGPAAGVQTQSQDDYFHQDMQWQADQPASDVGYGFETDLEQAIAMSAYEEQPAQPGSRRRGLFVVAAVGGVVILGGLGVFGMSMLGGGSDSPAIVRADPDPMKVRPENPGGTTVPNQDNEVYQRVSGAGSDAGPRQEQLITSAEEPVDVVARTVTPQEPTSALAPGVDDDVAQAAPATETRPVKSEERIEQVPQATSPVEAQETAMVTPRRVRTMVVRPDGTMVPREEPVAATLEPVEPAAAEPAVTEGEATSLVPMDQSVQPAGEIDDGPTLDMPQTVSVVPTQRSQAAQSQPAATPQPVAPQPAAPTQVAAAPVAAPTAAAAASEWSMQIASQPTAEGAQASYQDLARRYGSVLEGRGVNIVRADIDGRGTYYRVRIPASSRDEAIQLCTRYKAVGGSCFVSR